jgi:hypothetical protein
MVTPAKSPVPVNPFLWLELAVPALSFGGALLAILLLQAGVTLGSRFPSLGCIGASVTLAYLAWLRPRKDIVALSTPIYSILFFAMPSETLPGIVLQLLYAVSLTLLLVRLKHRFGERGLAGARSADLTGSLGEYLGRIRRISAGTTPEAAARAAIVFLRFSQGEYRSAAEVAGSGTSDNTAIGRACAIVADQAAILETPSFRPVTPRIFFPEDFPLLAKSLAGESEDRIAEAALENALLLLFGAAWIGSEADRPHLLTGRAFAEKLLGSTQSPAKTPPPG